MRVKLFLNLFLGTGKTYTAAAIAERFFLENSSQKSATNVLLCCPTNQAVNDAESLYLQIIVLPYYTLPATFLFSFSI